MSKEVLYGFLVEQDEMPEGRHMGRASALNDNVEKILERGTKGAVCIAAYGKKTAASAAANVMRQRYGRTATVRGLEFASRKVVVEIDGEQVERFGLWVTYDPSRIIEGHRELHEQEYAERQKRNRAQAREKAAQAKADPGAATRRPGRPVKA